MFANAEWRAYWNATEDLGYPYGPLFRLMALSGQRKSECAEAVWSEFDLAGKLWVIPARRMKMDAPHVVPLADDVIELLNSLPRFTRGEHLFSTTRGEKPVNGFSKAKARLDKAMLAQLGRLEPFVLHDVRRSIRTGLSALPVSADVAELVIGHAKRGLLRVYDQYCLRSRKAARARFVGRAAALDHSAAPDNVVRLAGGGWS